MLGKPVRQEEVGAGTPVNMGEQQEAWERLSITKPETQNSLTACPWLTFFHPPPSAPKNCCNFHINKPLLIKITKAILII